MIDSIDEELASLLAIPRTAKSIDSLREKNIESSHTLKSSAESFQPTSSTGQKNTVCLFCGHKQKKSGKQVYSLVLPKTSNSSKDIKTNAENSNGSVMLNKLQSETIAYHKVCCTNYRKTKKWHSQEHKKSDWHEDRKIHLFAYHVLEDFIDVEIIKNYKVLFFQQLVHRYRALLLEFGKGKITSKDISNN